MQSRIPCCIRSCCFLNRLKASEGRAEHTSAGKISRTSIYCVLKGSHPHHTMAEVFPSSFHKWRHWDSEKLRGSIRVIQRHSRAAWFLLSCLPWRTHSPGQSQRSVSGHGEQGPKSSPFWGPLLALGYLRAGRPLYSPFSHSHPFLPAKLQPVHPPTVCLAKAPPGVCIWIEAPAWKQTMRPVRNRGGLNPAHFCSPFFTSHPRAEDGSPLTQKAYFSTCSIIDSALLPLIRGLALLLRTVQFSLLVVSDSLATPWTEAHQASLSITNSQSPLKPMSIESVMPSNHLILSSPSPPALSLSQHQGLFQWVSSSHQLALLLELQLQHQSFQWIFMGWFPLGLTGLISLPSRGL